MNVEVRVFGPFHDVVGTRSITCPVPSEPTVGGVLEELVERHPDLESHLYEDGELADRLAITKNKSHVGQLEGLETPIEGGDTIRISPPISGGANEPVRTKS
ncbi:ubiquitin-like small modifier protein 1 [Natrarchaeobius oligotrophus]|nr:ubiquitin-like small modifier protein 1 [Natrarchaeobius chitinivorans]